MLKVSLFVSKMYNWFMQDAKIVIWNHFGNLRYIEDFDFSEVKMQQPLSIWPLFTFTRGHKLAVSQPCIQNPRDALEIEKVIEQWHSVEVASTYMNVKFCNSLESWEKVSFWKWREVRDDFRNWLKVEVETLNVCLLEIFNYLMFSS